MKLYLRIGIYDCSFPLLRWYSIELNAANLSANLSNALILVVGCLILMFHHFLSLGKMCIYIHEFYKELGTCSIFYLIMFLLLLKLKGFLKLWIIFNIISFDLYEYLWLPGIMLGALVCPTLYRHTLGGLKWILNSVMCTLP